MIEKIKVHFKNHKKKYLILLLLLLFLISLLVVSNFFRNNKYNIDKNPKVTIILIDRLVFKSNVCDELWIKEVNNLIKDIDNDYNALSKVSNQKGIKDFMALQKELSTNLRALLDYIESNKEEDHSLLVDNIAYSYDAYKTYYYNNFGGKS